MAKIDVSRLSRPPRILIVRLSAIGDTVLSLPLAAALRRAFPDCHLGWIAEKPSAALIEGNPLLDWVRVVPKEWLKSPALVWSLRRELRAEKFDMAVDAQGLTKSAIAAWLSGAKVRIGFTRGEGRELAPLLNNTLIAPQGVHAVDMALSFLGAFGVKVPAEAEFVFPACPKEDARAIDAALGCETFSGGFVLLGPWGSFPSKLWPLERFRELAEKLREETGLPSVMLGHGEQERGEVARLVAGISGSLFAAPDVSLAGVVEIARRARLFVGCDSFPMHAASAVGTPTLGLFGVTNPVRLGPYGANGHSVFERVTLVKSTRERRRLGTENMAALSTEKVFRAAVNIFSPSGEKGQTKAFNTSCPTSPMG